MPEAPNLERKPLSQYGGKQRSLSKVFYKDLQVNKVKKALCIRQSAFLMEGADDG
jgi:hypothetical protein